MTRLRKIITHTSSLFLIYFSSFFFPQRQFVFPSLRAEALPFFSCSDSSTPNRYPNLPLKSVPPSSAKAFLGHSVSQRTVATVLRNETEGCGYREIGRSHLSNLWTTWNGEGRIGQFAGDEGRSVISQILFSEFVFRFQKH